MSLYDDLGVETSDSKTEGWSKNFKLLQSQLQVKKAALTQAKVQPSCGFAFCFSDFFHVQCIVFVTSGYQFGVILLGFVHEFVAKNLAKLRGEREGAFFLMSVGGSVAKLKFYEN